MSKETFDFSEALRRMKQGKKVHRKYERELYSVIEGNIVSGESGQNIGDWYVMGFPFHSKDILATDWEEVKE